MQAFIDLLKHYQAYGLVAFVVAVLSTPIAANLAQRLGVMDIPDRKLKPHARPTPYLGGAAICLGWTMALLLAMWRGTVSYGQLLPIMLGGIAFSVIGLIDDIKEVPPKLRLALGTLITVVVMLTTGIGQELAASFLYPLHIHPPVWVETILSFLIGLLIVLGACNSTNLIDGLDGLAAGVTAVISLGFFVIAAHLAIVEYSRLGNPVRLVLALAMFGAVLGFLPLNFNPAKVFMGDAGSVLLGYNCGIMLLLFDERGIPRWLIGGLMVFALPIFDTALAIVRRLRSGRSVFAGDRSHFYDQLIDRGMSVRQVVLISYGLAGFYALVGCLSIWIRLRYTVLIYAVVVALTVLVVVKAGMLRPEPPAQPKSPQEQ